MTSQNRSLFANVSDDELLCELKRIVGKGQQLEAELLVQLAEVDARRLYLREACSSMFVYCTRVLHFSESAAYHRIAAARAARSYPALLEQLEAGEIHLSGITLLAPHLTPENHLDLLSRAKHQSKRAIELLVADVRPRPAAPAIVRRLPAPPQTGCAIPRPPPPTPKPLGRQRFKIQLTASQETHDKLRELQALLRHQIPNGDLAQIFERALDLLLDDVKRKKFARTQRPRAVTSRTKPSRHIPAEIKRAVVSRDEGRCRYVSPSGRRCKAREFLEFHHVEPWGHSQRHSREEIVLMCRAHNQYEGEHAYGHTHMQRFRELARTTPPGGS